MTKQIIWLLVIVSAGVLAGIQFGILLGFNPGNLSALAYLEQQQISIQALNTFMPLLGLFTILLSVTAGVIHRQAKTIFITMLMAAFLLIASGLITRFGNQPINSVVMTWNKDNLPLDWIDLRNRWWTLHVVRTTLSLLAFCLIVISGQIKSRESH